MWSQRDLSTIRQYVHNLVREPYGEVEFRFSTRPHPKLFETPNSTDGKGRVPKNYRFQPGVSQDVFYRALNTIDGYRLQKSTTESTDQFFADGLRYTDATHFVQKKRIRYFDFWNLDIRLSLSTETPVTQNVPTTPPHYIRYKQRVSYLDHYVRYDFTTIRLPDGSTTYEIEIEILKAPIRNLDEAVSSASMAVMHMLQIIQGGRKPMTLSEQYELSNEYAKLTGTTVRGEKVKFIGAQPETLHQRHVQQVLSGSHAITPKLDGERSLLFVSQNGHAYQLGRNERFIASGLWSRQERGTMMDVEMCNGMLHAFDLIYRQGRRCTEHLHDRLEMLRAAVGTLVGENKQNRQAPVMIAKQHYFSDLPRYFKEWDKSTSEAGQPLREGFIFTPIEEAYPTSTKWPSLLKWKPYEANSIDFQVHDEGNGRWTLLVGDTERRMIPFEPFPAINASSFAGSMSMHGNIVECRWNGETFVPTRWRRDRSFPNYKTVAQDVWESIQNPVRATDFYQPPRPVALLSLPSPAVPVPAPSCAWQKALMERVVRLYHAEMLGKAAGKALVKRSWADAMDDEESESCGLRVLDLTAGHAQGDWKQPGFSAEVVHQSLLNPSVPEHSQPQLISGQFDVIDCREILPNFYASESTFTHFLKTVCERLRSGGYLLTTFLDGHSVYETCARMLESDYLPLFDVRFPLAHLRKQEFQHTFRVAGNSQTMHLVFSDLFVKRMTDAGFECVETQLVQDVSKPDRPKQYRTFILRYSPGRTFSRWSSSSHPTFGDLHTAPLAEVGAALGLNGGEKLEASDHTSLEAFADTNGTYVNVARGSTEPLSEYAPKVTLDEGTTILLVVVNDQLHLACRKCEDTGEKVSRFSRPKPNPAAILLERPLTGKNAWTIKELQALALEKGIRVPSKERVKADIYTFILNTLSS